MSFQSLGLHEDLLQAIEDLGYQAPTPIQLQAIPPAIEGKDLLACAMTGSGKTAAFLLPTLDRLMDLSAGKTRVLVLTPTRELSAQVCEDATALARHTTIEAASIYGGVPMRPQEKAFRAKVDILVACPGRLLDHLQYPYASLKDIQILVLDEADRMLDMGFLPEIRRILKQLPNVEQTLFFSATMPPPIARLAEELLKDPVSIAVDRVSQPADGVKQRVYEVDGKGKTDLLLDLLSNHDLRSVLAFTRTKHRANRLAKQLAKHGVQAERIHGNRTQGQRERALASFKTGQIRVLVATDIAARGIDVDDLSHVINYDVPRQPEDYIHRVGRTARARRTGHAFTFASPEEGSELKAIERTLKKRLERYDHRGSELSAESEMEDAAPGRKGRGSGSKKASNSGAKKSGGNRRPKKRGDEKSPQRDEGQRAASDMSRGTAAGEGSKRPRRRRRRKAAGASGGETPRPETKGQRDAKAPRPASGSSSKGAAPAKGDAPSGRRRRRRGRRSPATPKG